MAINDTRLLHAKADMETALDEAYETSRSGFRIDDPDGVELRAIVAEQDRLLRRLIALLDPELFVPCGKTSSTGSTCYRQKDHGDWHRSQWGRVWSDESDRLSSSAIAKSMEGRRD